MTSLGSRSHVRVCGDLQGCSRSRNPSRAQFKPIAAKIDSQVVVDAVSWGHLHGLVRLSSSHDAQAHEDAQAHVHRWLARHTLWQGVATIPSLYQPANCTCSESPFSAGQAIQEGSENEAGDSLAKLGASALSPEGPPEGFVKVCCRALVSKLLWYTATAPRS